MRVTTGDGPPAVGGLSMGTPDGDPLLADRLRAHGEAAPDAVAAVCDGRSVGYAALVAEAEELAARFELFGVGAGGAGRIGVVGANSLAYAVVVAACQLAGATVVPLPLLVAADARARMIADAGVAILFCDEDMLDAMRVALEEADVVVAATVPLTVDRDFGGWMPRSVVAPSRQDVRGDWTSDVIYSSGTTGVPKGIAQSFEGRARQCTGIGRLGFGRGVQVMLTIGLSSNFGFTALLAAWWWGGCCQMTRRYSGEWAVDLLRREAIGIAFLPPAPLVRTMDAAGFVEAVKERRCVKISSGAPLSAGQKRRVVQDWPGDFYEIYGQTETATATVLPVHEVEEEKLGSVGRAAPGVAIRIVADDGTLLPVGEEGEIAVHSPTLMSGYEGRRTDDAATYWSDEGGRRFVRTGDVGRLDAEGYLWLGDRRKDMIISGGYNVYPADIEKVLSDHPAVFEVAVIGCPSRRWGETPVGVVTLVPGASASTDALRDWANARLGPAQRLAVVRIVAELPSGGMGKILKRELRSTILEDLGVLA